MVSTIVHSQTNDLINNPQFKEVESLKKEENSTFEENYDDPSTKKMDVLKNIEENDENEKNVNISYSLNL